ncbi:glycine/betaine ABC transporter permease [Leptospira kanakyensis]|uniref:glycine/betaine ABC transporter permease n=1 Tax=Leptospira kanakyensis TaxID=2484968 RepID=UPI00223D1FB9|nr:glycine/betaine ABC transporter permease [Leptospira kanakyensis]MCW7483245.1 glycine/betaine ABC transporter permease [Leptospira kanakyensis]
MNPSSLLNAIGEIIYWIVYLVNPDFREEEKIKEIERKEYQKLTLEIQKSKDQEKAKRLFEESRLRKINNNENLVEICLDDPVFCDEYKILIEKIKHDLTDLKLKIKFEEEWNNTFNNINYGCYCRKYPNLEIYNNCPIDENSLDFVCKSRHICISSKGLNWTESIECNSDFSSFLESIPYSYTKNSESFTNHDILVFTANKYKALLSIKKKLK